MPEHEVFKQLLLLVGSLVGGFPVDRGSFFSRYEAVVQRALVRLGRFQADSVSSHRTGKDRIDHFQEIIERFGAESLFRGVSKRTVPIR